MVLFGILGSEPNRMDQLTRNMMDIQLSAATGSSTGDGNNNEPTMNGATTIIKI